jgi:hypothetical protein
VQVLWEGRPADYTIEPGISFAWIVLGLPSCASGAVRIVYGHEALPRLSTPERDPMNGRITLTVDRGRIIGLNQTGTGADVSGIAPDGRTCAVSPPSGSDTRTVFVLVEHADIRAWYPSEIPALGHIAAMAQPPLCPWPSGQTEMVDIRRFCNQRLSGLHSNTYTPQAEAFSWAPQLRTVLPNGRSWWETHQHGKIIPDLSAWEGSSDCFRTDAGIPFIHHAEGPDGAFTSLYDQFPSRIEIPLERRGRRVAVLLAASTNPAQSRIENGRITVRMKDGALRSLALTNPETIDDWLSNGTGVPYVLGGRVQALGSGTHALLHEIDLGGEADIESLALETFSNEVLIGLLGISLLL